MPKKRLKVRAKYGSSLIELIQVETFYLPLEKSGMEFNLKEPKFQLFILEHHCTNKLMMYK